MPSKRLIAGFFASGVKANEQFLKAEAQ